MALDKGSRLRLKQDFKSVLSRGTKNNHRFFLLYSLENQLPKSRLGMIVPKKKLPGAVQRNRCKRVLRAVFRQSMLAQKSLLRTGSSPYKSKDYVVLVKRGLSHEGLASWKRLFQKALDCELAKVKVEA